MACCTYLNESETRQPIINKHVAEWLDNARKATGVKIVVLERRFDYYRWFKKKTNWRYEILWPLIEPEYQCMNFYREGTDWTINMLVPAEMAVAYLMGVCAHQPEKESEG